MDFLKNVSNKVKTDSNTGFGANAINYGGRFVNKNGDANVRKTGIGLFKQISWYHAMINISRWKFVIVVISFYILINLLFAAVYYLIGAQYLNGITATNELGKFSQIFFFSAQTYTTVGYGHVNPTGFLTSVVSAFQALLGLLTFAIATGLFYGRFSKPKAHILFSENALIAPYNGGKALMIRLTPFKNTNLTDVEAKITLGIHVKENAVFVNKFYNLELEISKLNLLTLSWTLVHPITETSPLYGFTQEDFLKIEGELLVYLKMFDDMFSNTVVKRTSYIFEEVVYGAKFNPMFSKNKQNTQTVLHIDKLNSFELVSL